MAQVSERYEQNPSLYLNVLWEKKKSGSRYPQGEKKSNSPSGSHWAEKQSKVFFLKRIELIHSSYDRNLSQWLIIG